jgi:hypothetical protein
MSVHLGSTLTQLVQRFASIVSRATINPLKEVFCALFVHLDFLQSLDQRYVPLAQWGNIYHILALHVLYVVRGIIHKPHLELYHAAFAKQGNFLYQGSQHA